MGIRANAPGLFVAGLAVALGALGSIVWAHSKPNVTVPQRVTWAHPAPVCPSADIEDWALELAMVALQDAGVPVVLELGPCPLRAAIHLSEDVAAVDRIFPPVATMDGDHGRGAYERRVFQDLIVDCRAYVASGADAPAIAHEILHCMGYDHARYAPIGHVLHKDYAKISLDDFRGVGSSR